MKTSRLKLIIFSLRRCRLDRLIILVNRNDVLEAIAATGREQTDKRTNGLDLDQLRAGDAGELGPRQLALRTRD
jgi:hypothetical protein